MERFMVEKLSTAEIYILLLEGKEERMQLARGLNMTRSLDTFILE